MFKNNIHLFRGLSIIIIVFSHCYYCFVSAFGQNKGILAKVFQSLVTGGSSFFVFVSGFLFLTLYKSNSGYYTFIIKKIKHVYWPFFVFISFDIIYILFRVIQQYFLPYLKSRIYSDDLCNFDFTSRYLLGNSFITSGILWYVPFIMFVFLLSPVFLFYSRLRANIRFIIFFISVLVSLFLFRSSPRDLLSLIQNLVYFLPFYFLGILASQYESILYSRNNKVVLFILSLLSILLVVIKVILENNFVINVDILLFQKLLFCILIILYLKNVQCKILEVFANNSFGIYFVHPIILYIVGYLTSLFHVTYRSNSFLIYGCVASVILFLSLIVVLILKRLFGTSSRYFLGV
jgi:peptidoglycan/LPS O-acetylase OafA/YrhL